MRSVLKVRGKILHCGFFRRLLEGGEEKVLCFAIAPLPDTTQPTVGVSIAVRCVLVLFSAWLKKYTLFVALRSLMGK